MLSNSPDLIKVNIVSARDADTKDYGINGFPLPALRFQEPPIIPFPFASSSVADCRGDHN